MADKVVVNAYLVFENLCLLSAQLFLLVERKENNKKDGGINILQFCSIVQNLKRQMKFQPVS